MWRCNLRPSVFLWFDFPRRPLTGGSGIVVLVEYFRRCVWTYGVLLVWLGWSVFRVRFVRSSPLAPVTRFRVEHPCLSLLRLRDHVLDAIGVRAVGREMLAAELPPVVKIRHIGLGAADEIAT